MASYILPSVIYILDLIQGITSLSNKLTYNIMGSLIYPFIDFFFLAKPSKQIQYVCYRESTQM